MKEERLILVTNDDGYDSKGLAAAVEVARGFGRVVVVAPETTQSGMSQAITMYNPLYLRCVRKEEGLEVYAFSGTPVDCVKMAFDYLLREERVDLVISGINHGSNSAVNVLYSGTMGAAIEAPEAVAILNKQDLAAVIEPSDLPFAYIVPISCKDGTGFDLLEQAFDMLFPDDTPCDGSLLTNARQAGAILRAKKSVDSAVQSLRAGMTPDAVLVDLESAMDALGEVTGRTMREDITNRIFERFCVGK